MKRASSLPVFSPLPDGVAFVREYRDYDLVLCTHDQAHRANGRCSICKGDMATTDAFKLPVKMLANVPADARVDSQAALF